MDVEKTVEFLLEHHARFAEDMEELKERAKEHERVLARHNDQIAQVTDLIGRVAQANLVLNQRVVDVTEGFASVSSRLDALIVVVEKYLTRGNARP